MRAGVHKGLDLRKLRSTCPGSPHRMPAGADVTEEPRPLHLGVTPFPYVAGARSMLDPSASGFHRTVVARAPVQTVTLRREPEAIAFTAPGNASLFELETGNGMLLPFEGMVTSRGPPIEGTTATSRSATAVAAHSWIMRLSGCDSCHASIAASHSSPLREVSEAGKSPSSSLLMCSYSSDIAVRMAC